MRARSGGITVCLMALLMNCLCLGAPEALVVELDTSAVPEQAAWGQEAKELIEEWYPRVCHMLASKDFEPPRHIKITLRNSDRGIADASGPHIRVSSGWIEKHPEDIGLVFHELVHVIQRYPTYRPSWLVEGIADYLRWGIFEGKPQEWFSVPNDPKGYEQSYRVTGGFLLWLESDRAPGIVKKLNAAMRQRTYSNEMFEKETGLGLEALWAAYVAERNGTATETQAAVAVEAAEWQLGPFVRPVSKPVIAPRKETRFACPMSGEEIAWESSDTFNPAAVVHDGDVCVLYRAEDGSGNGIGSHTSRIGLARSDDGLAFERHPTPVFYPDKDTWKGYEWNGGCEDPRVVEGPDGTFYMYYTMWNRDNPEGVRQSARIGVASSKDLVTWVKHGPIFKEAYGGKFVDTWHKASSVVTEVRDGRLQAVKIGGKFWMYWGENRICGATSDDLIAWTPVCNRQGELKTIISPRPGKFDSLLTEAGPPAVVTDEGIVLIYNGKNAGADKTIAGGAYAAGQVLLDKADPMRVLKRCDNYFFKPELDFEKTGQYTDGTVFVEGLVYFQSKWYLYYGTADSYVGVAVCGN